MSNVSNPAQGAIYYGIDSASYTTQVVPGLIRQWGVPPSFVMRYLGNYQETPVEGNYLKSLNIRLGLVYNLGGATRNDGMAAQAEDAVARMKNLGLHCPIFKDIETSMPTDSDGLTAWSGALERHGVPGGFYANTAWPDFNDPYNEIVRAVPRRYRLIWASEPEPGYSPPTSPPAFAPSRPTGDPSAVVLWQFVENWGDVDCNLATEELYNLLEDWSGKPPVREYRVTKGGALKTQPSHRSPVAIDPRHRRVYLNPGDLMVPTGRFEVTDERWREFHLLKGLAVVHGWYPDRQDEEV